MTAGSRSNHEERGKSPRIKKKLKYNFQNPWVMGYREI